MRRFLAVFAAAALALMLCGCGRLSRTEYYEQLTACFEEYSAALEEFDTVRADVTSSQEIMLEQTKATEICERAEKALDGFTKMNPPEEFAKKHEELLAAVELERKFVTATKKVLTARTPDELSKYGSEAETIFNGIPEEKQFAAVYGELSMEVKSAAGGE